MKNKTIRNKIIIFLLMMLIPIGLFANGTAEDAGDVGGIEKIKMIYFHGGAVPKDLPEVQEAVNSITREAIHVEVEFIPMFIFDSLQGKIHLMIASGEQIDLLAILGKSVAEYANQGELIPLDDLLAEYAPAIAELSKEFPLAQMGGMVNGEIYGISPLPASIGNQMGFIMRKDWFDELYLTPKEMYSIDDITKILSAVKAKHPDTFPSGISVNLPAINAFIVHDNLGIAKHRAGGVLMDYDSTTVVNIYETEEYYNYITTIREWYEAGYIHPDAATCDLTLIEMAQGGVLAMYPMPVEPTQLIGTEEQWGWESIGLRTTEGFMSSTAGAGWAVPVTSKSPKAAVRFLDLMYSNHELSNLLLWGIEGKHFVKTDEEQVINFPAGVDATNSGYFNTFGLYGDRRYEYQWDIRATKPYTDVYTEENMKNKFKSFGYIFDPSSVASQFTAVNSVLDQFLPAFDTGIIEGISTYYYTFIDKLRKAGIDDVIAANQEQLDKWLVEQE